MQIMIKIMLWCDRN